MFILIIHGFSWYLIEYTIVRKIYFFDTDPPQAWEKIIETKNGKTVSQTPWVLSEKLNGDSQTIASRHQIHEMLEEDIEGFAEFMRELGSNGMKIKY